MEEKMDELLQQLITYAGEDYEESQEPFLVTLLDDALEEVVNFMYPFGFASEDDYIHGKYTALKRYPTKIRKIAEYHYDKRGIEGMSSYSESGFQSTYSDAGTPKSYFRGIVPVALIV